MTDAHMPDSESMTPVKRALLEIRDLRARLAAAEAARVEPIAIVGMGLRFPGGANDAASFARLLWNGVDTIAEIPGERWSLDALYAADADEPGKMITRRGAFIDHVDQFDADFFGISPREAASMDPQQRILLEVAWEALEDAGLAPSRLTGSNGGVYLGICNSDYGRALFARPDMLDVYASTGNAYSVAAGRLSYFLGWHGPSMAVDTACSSSLVALHLACQALRLRECNLALAGGINLVLTPDMNICFSKARMMAPDGRCKTFDAAADGYVRGEGCAIVALRRLSDALADDDRILAVVRGSAVNQDGRSGGLTAPNGPAQEAVIRAALAAANLPPAAIGYVETHGTGTPLGDPIEVGALGAVFSAERDPGRPLMIGSVKTNIGHLEAAAGIAGVIKVVLALQRGEIPPHLHLESGNPLIDWAHLPITVPVTKVPWSSDNGRLVAGVSSFGFSGCNAHAILEQAAGRDQPVSTGDDRPMHLLALSARNAKSLGELAQRYQATLTEGADAADICYTANAGRSHFGTRLSVAGATKAELQRGLQAFVDATPHESVATGWHDGAMRPQVAFLFTGQGAQYAQMGLRLRATSPTFRAALDQCAAGLAPYMDRGLLELLHEAREATPVDRTLYAQPATFAIEYALAALWRSWGIEPAAVIGHSLGEYAAACVAGIIPLGDALRLVAERGRLTETLARDGTMAAVFAKQAIVEAEVRCSDGALTVAAYNGPEHFVVSGTRDAVSAMVARMSAAGIRVRPLRVSYAAHSRLIDPVAPAFRQILETVRFQPNRIALISNVTGALAGAEEIGNADYWITHMREPVRFAESIATLAAQGITHCIEVGPHPVLLGMAAECLPGSDMEWLPSLRRDRPEWPDLIESLQRLYVGGAEIDWNGFDRGYLRRRVALPSYPFHRRRHWIDIAGDTQRPIATAQTRWALINAALSRQADQGPLDLNASTYPAKWACLERLTLGHAIRTLRDVGLFRHPGESRTLQQVLQEAEIGDVYRRLVQRWLDGLVVSGVLRKDAEVYVADTPLPDPGLSALWSETEHALADNQPLLAYLRQCGELLSDVLCGRESPLETLFPQASFELAEDLYQRSTAMRYMNGLVAAALGSLAETVPAGRPLRLLEVGAGTGGTSSAALAVLPADRTRYVFSDVSDVFLDRARERFGQYAFASYMRFDMDRDTAEQGFLPASFDVVVSANAVHASADLPKALDRLRDLLAPGGLLILLESTTHLAWFDMTTGLMDGWQHFTDDLRGDHPLLAATRWIEVLRDVGFVAAEAWPRADSAATHLGQHVVIARAPGDLSNKAGEAEIPGYTDSRIQPLVAHDTEATDRLRTSIIEALPTERHDLICDFVRDQVMRILRRDENEPPARNDRLMDLGLDSLMAVRLRDQLGKRLGLGSHLSATLMFDHPTIDALASYLCERLAPADEIGSATPTAEVHENWTPIDVATVSGMSDAEIEARLAQRLG